MLLKAHLRKSQNRGARKGVSRWGVRQGALLCQSEKRTRKLQQGGRQPEKQGRKRQGERSRNRPWKNRAQKTAGRGRGEKNVQVAQKKTRAWSHASGRRDRGQSEADQVGSSAGTRKLVRGVSPAKTWANGPGGRKKNKQRAEENYAARKGKGRKRTGKGEKSFWW